MNRVMFLIWSATRVAPAVRAVEPAAAGVAFGAGLDRLERLRVWPNVAAGRIRVSTSEAMAVRFNMFLLCDFPGMSDCRMTPKEYKVVA